MTGLSRRRQSQPLSGVEARGRRLVHGAEPDEVAAEIFCGNATEPAHPFFQAAMVGVDVLHMPGAIMTGFPSVQRMTFVGKIGCRAATICAESSTARMKSVLSPERSRATRTGTCSCETPRWWSCRHGALAVAQIFVSSYYMSCQFRLTGVM